MTALLAVNAPDCWRDSLHLTRRARRVALVLTLWLAVITNGRSNNENNGFRSCNLSGCALFVGSGSTVL